MSTDADVIIACACYLVITRKKRKGRRVWVRKTLLARQKYTPSEYYLDMCHDEKEEDFLRVKKTDFEYLLNLIGHKIVKKDTNWRPALSVADRLIVTLRFLSSGSSYMAIGSELKISDASISRIVPEVCAAIAEGLQEYIKAPRTELDWNVVQTEYDRKWNFPHCIGSIDGKHIAIIKPIHSGSEFYNYKGFYSIILFAVVDADYNFLFIDIGCQGRISDGGVFANTTFRKEMIKKNLNLPQDKPLPNGTIDMPYVVVADDAFPLEKHIMKPFDGRHGKNSKERIYNYRLSRARRTVENAFGILSAKFRVLRTTMNLEPEKAGLVVTACAYLHNFFKKRDTDASYVSAEILDTEDTAGNLIPGRWRSHNQLTPVDHLSTLELGKETRKEFSNYFVSGGRVEWQYERN